jgi:hypothetical protein
MDSGHFSPLIPAHIDTNYFSLVLTVVAHEDNNDSSGNVKMMTVKVQ